jgi:DNA invertase Pin-like site-specific DNA recombinase
MTLMVLIIARISTVHQDRRSLDDQIALCKRFVLDRHVGPVEFTVISGQGSGEVLDRADFLKTIEFVESQRFDWVITEDLARICRRAQAMIFCETCEDSDMRFVAVNDAIDTSHTEWRVNAFFASFKHEMSNKDTSMRIRRTLRNRFDQGGVVQFVIYGIIKPPGAKNDSDLQRDPSAEEIYKDWFQRFREGASCSEIADWLNQQVVPTGPYCRSKRWTGPMVARVMRNPLLKGCRIRNRVMSRRHNKTGRRRSVKAPPGELLVRKCPHLAFFDEQYYDETIAMLAERNAHFKRKLVNGRDPRAGVPKKRSRWPGQHFICGICGRSMRYGGNGISHCLICTGANEYRCWNSVTINAPFAARQIITAVRDAISNLPGFDVALADKVRLAAHERIQARQTERADCERGLNDRIRQLENTAAAIGARGHSATLLDRLKSLEGERDEFQRKLAILDKQPESVVELPSMDVIREVAFREFEELAVESPEFGRWMKQIIPRLAMRPVRCCTGGTPEPRAFVTLDLTSLVPADIAGAAGSALRIELVVDLFDPPKRVILLKEIQRLTQANLKQREVAKLLGTQQPIVQQALAIARKMAELGITSPYIELSEPPSDYRKMRRCRHPRYRFEPLPGFGTDEAA